MMRRLWFLAVLLVFAGNPEARAAKNTAIFIPGFKGSRLINPATGQLTWLEASQAFWHVEDVALHVTPQPPARLSYLDANFERLTHLRVDGVLTRVNLLLGLTYYDIYESWLSDLQKTLGPEYEVIPFAYDWRQDNVESVAELSRLVDELKAKGRDKIILIGHSMGGLIASYYLRYGTQPPESAQPTWKGAQNISAVVFGGTPFRGYSQILYDLQFGTTSKLNSPLLSPQALQSFPSSYQMVDLNHPVKKTLPHDKRAAVNLREPETWLNDDWGLGRGCALAAANQQERCHRMLREWIERAVAFSDRTLAPRTAQEKPPALKVFNLVGVSHPTLSELHCAMIRTGCLLEIAAHDDGDKLVLKTSAALPPAFRELSDAQETTTTATHGLLFKDRASRNQVLAFLKPLAAN